MVQTWTVGEIIPASTPPATDIGKITDALAALKSQFSGASLPATNLVGGLIALDTTNNVYWRRDPANTKWMLHKSAADALVVAKTGAYTAVLGDFEKTLVCTNSWTLGFSAAATLTDGWWVRVSNAGSGTITIDPNGAETIDGAATLALASGDDCIIICDGSGFRTLRHAAVSGSASQAFSVAAATADAHATRKDQIAVANSALVATALNASGAAPIYACRAWVNFNGTGTVAIRGSGNVSSITDNGTGDYTINFTTAMPDANYAVNATKNNESSNVGSHVKLGALAAGSVQINSIENGAATDCSTICVSVSR